MTSVGGGRALAPFCLWRFGGRVTIVRLRCGVAALIPFWSRHDGCWVWVVGAGCVGGRYELKTPTHTYAVARHPIMPARGIDLIETDVLDAFGQQVGDESSTRWPFVRTR